MIIVIHIIFIILLFIIYSLYVQFSSTMGNIWLRTNSEGLLTFCPINLFNLLRQPLIEPYFWELNFLPINFWFYLIVYFAFYYSLTCINNLL